MASSASHGSVKVISTIVSSHRIKRVVLPQNANSIFVIYMSHFSIISERHIFTFLVIVEYRVPCMNMLLLTSNSPKHMLIIMVINTCKRISTNIWNISISVFVSGKLPDFFSFLLTITFVLTSINQAGGHLLLIARSLEVSKPHDLGLVFSNRQKRGQQHCWDASNFIAMRSL